MVVSLSWTGYTGPCQAQLVMLLHEESSPILRSSWVGHLKTTNNFRTEASTDAQFAPLKRSRQSIKVLQPWRVCCSGKCCFKFPYKSLWANKKPQHCRPKHAWI